MRRSLHLILLACCGLAALIPAQAEALLGPRRKQEARIRLSVILIPILGVSKSDKALPRAEALELCESLRKRLRKGEPFAELAKTHSADSSALLGGYLGQLRRSSLRPELRRALDQLELGREPYFGPVETPIGLFLLWKHEIQIPWPDTLSCAHILVSHREAVRPRGRGPQRSRDQASIEAQKIYALLKAGQSTFGKAAQLHSDDGETATNGGRIGTVRSEDLVATFIDAALRLEPGTFSAPVETPFGYHLIQRLDRESPFHASHILFPWSGCRQVPRGMVRSKVEALEAAKRVLTGIQNHTQFTKAARRHSTCPSAIQGGDLGSFHAGKMLAPFERAVRDAKPGDLVGPVETAYGYHLIWRHR